MNPKSKKKTIATNSGLLAYTFTKLDDNLANNDRDILIDISNSTRKYSPFGNHAERAN